MRTIALAVALVFFACAGHGHGFRVLGDVNVQSHATNPQVALRNVLRASVAPRSWVSMEWTPSWKNQARMDKYAAKKYGLAISVTEDADDSVDAEELEDAEACVPFESVYSNDKGTWIVTPEGFDAEELERDGLPNGLKFCEDPGVQTQVDDKVAVQAKKVDSKAAVQEKKAAPSKAKDTPKKKKKSVWEQGIFAPAVVGAKKVMGENELKKLRADIIGKHTKVISSFVDTSDSKFGQLVLKRMFEAADKDNSGTLDKEEVRDALHSLGFTFVDDKQMKQIWKKADLDGDEVIDFEEFVKETPKTLRTSLVKLAKSNGHDLGFLA